MTVIQLVRRKPHNQPSVSRPCPDCGNPQESVLDALLCPICDKMLVQHVSTLLAAFRRPRHTAA